MDIKRSGTQPSGKGPAEVFHRLELPGIDPKDITVNVVGDMLTIRASRQEEHETKKRDFLHREFR